MQYRIELSQNGATSSGESMLTTLIEREDHQLRQMLISLAGMSAFLQSEDEISNKLDISHGSLHKIITQYLYYRKVCVRWVPCLLTEEHKAQQWLSDVGREFFAEYIVKLVRASTFETSPPLFKH
ncbi:hypothetical protein AVEN_113990-1 [Araneus ventricosus]|uniref:Uncharacterized protein n=1 Tax=Araneus ventricosus TaxID=182803 RepID=A0A4Y2K142_ARAVE|nr:hypothetical protein AVEN_113990-1 [Araneus ventricosus]